MCWCISFNLLENRISFCLLAFSKKKLPTTKNVIFVKKSFIRYKITYLTQLVTHLRNAHLSNAYCLK